MKPKVSDIVRFVEDDRDIRYLVTSTLPVEYSRHHSAVIMISGDRIVNSHVHHNALALVIRPGWRGES